MRTVAEEGGQESAARCDSLTWVVVDGVPAPVSRFADLPPRRRPPATCPQCAQPVVLKLGKIKVHHAAHRPGDEACPASQPEGALHISVKCYLAAELMRGQLGQLPLFATEPCAVGRRYLLALDPTSPEFEYRSAPCPDAREHLAALRWDPVHLERRIADRRRQADRAIARTLDIVLTRSGDPVLAIEVFATHRVDDEKAKALAELGVPWVEVRADPALIAGEQAWTIDTPLRVARRSGGQIWRCSHHQAEHNEWLQAMARRREYDERDRELRMMRESARESSERALEQLARDRLSAQHVQVRAARIVDFYQRSGEIRRRFYFVLEDQPGCFPRRVVLTERHVTIETWTPDFGSDGAMTEVSHAVREVWKRDCIGLREAEESRIDSPMRWLHGPLAEEVAVHAATGTSHSARLLWDAFPPRLEFLGRGRWRLIDEMKDETWDRPDDDALTPHRAAHHVRRARRRERDRAR